MIGDKVVVSATSAGPAPDAASLAAIGEALRAAGFQNLVAILGPGNARPF